MTVPSNLPPPSRNPTDDDTMLGVFNVVLRKFLQGTDGMLPAKIVAYDKATNTAQVQPLMSKLLTDNTIVERAPILSVPVEFSGGGGFMVKLPELSPGDLGFIKANDVDISLFKQSLDLSIPNSTRLHSFSDATFVPLVLVPFTIGAGDDGRLVLQKMDASMRISLGANALVTDDDSYTANAGAVLDVQSTAGALKIPRMTHGQRDAIPSPEGGFMVYVTDTPTGFSFYTDGVGWS